jgi:hypothetical protein
MTTTTTNFETFRRPASPKNRKRSSKRETAVQTDTQIENEIAIDLTPITTDEYGPLSIADLEAIDDLVEQGVKAAALLRAVENAANVARSVRDIGGLVLIQPYQAIQRPYDAAMDKIDAALEAGKITPATAYKRREAAKQARRDGMVGIQYKPVHVYRDIVGVSRGLFVRMQHREASLPTAEQYLADVCIDDPRMDMVVAEALAEDGATEVEAVAAVAMFKRDECKHYDAIAVEARAIRDEAATMLLNGNPKIGRPAMSNADVARLFKLTTARVAQMRYGTR